MAMFQILNVEPMDLRDPIRVACVGDSITQGSGYPAKLQVLLGTNYSVGNFGVSGSTVTLNSTKPYMNQTAFEKAQQFQPKVVVIMLGTNDARTDLMKTNPVKPLKPTIVKSFPLSKIMITIRKFLSWIPRQFSPVTQILTVRISRIM